MTEENVERLNAVTVALQRLNHDQNAVGLGFDLAHNPQTCIRCMALFSVNKMALDLQRYESEKEAAITV